MASQATQEKVATEIPADKADARERGIKLFEQKNYVEAAKLLRKATNTHKSDHLAWYFLGLTLIHQHKLKDATKALETTVKLRPEFGAGHTGLAYSLLLRNKVSGAVDRAEAAMAIDPRVADNYYVIGVARLRKNDNEEALKNAEAAIKLNPRFAPGYLLKSQALSSFFGDVLILEAKESPQSVILRFGQAAEALEKYLALNPNAEEKETWVEQLESLRHYLRVTGPNAGERTVFFGKEVSTKVRVLRKPEPSYTEAARSYQVTGTVILRTVFGADGKVKHFLVVQGLPYGLTEAAIRAARQIKFTPATINGRPVSMFIQLEYNFNLY